MVSKEYVPDSDNDTPEIVEETTPAETSCAPKVMGAIWPDEWFEGAPADLRAHIIAMMPAFYPENYDLARLHSSVKPKVQKIVKAFKIKHRENSLNIPSLRELPLSTYGRQKSKGKKSKVDQLPGVAIEGRVPLYGTGPIVNEPALLSELTTQLPSTLPVRWVSPLSFCLPVLLDRIHLCLLGSPSLRRLC